MSETCPGCGGEITTHVTEYGGTYEGCETCAYRVGDGNVETPALEQLEAVRRSGLTNMLDVNLVQKIAFESELHALVTFIEENGAQGIFNGGAKAREKYEGEELSVDVPESVEVTYTIN